MKFAFETIIWGRRIDDLDEVLDTIAAFGYQGVELAQSPGQILIRQEAGTTKILSDLGPQVLQEKLLFHGRVHGLEDGLVLVGMAGGRFRERLDFCLRSPDLRPFLYVEDLEESDQDLLDAVTADPPFVVALHPHWFKRIQRISHAATEIQTKITRLGRQLDEGAFPNIKQRGISPTQIRQQFKLLPDTAHLTIAGDEMPRKLPASVELAAVHLKDWISTHGRHSHRYAQGFVPLGDGEVPIREVLDALRGPVRNYQGWVIVEQDLTQHSIVEAIIRCTRWLIGWSSDLKLHLPEKFCRAPGDDPSPWPEKPVEGESQRELTFLRKVLPTTTLGPRRFYQQVTDALLGLGGFITVQVFSWQPGKDESQKSELLRLGASGLPGTKHILPTLDCLCGTIVRDPVVQVFDLREEPARKRFRDRELLSQLDERYRELDQPDNTPLRMISVPVFNASNPQHLRYILNLFPDPGYVFDRAEREEIELIGRHISRLADHVSDEICSAAFLKTSYLSRTANTRRAYLDALRDMIRQEFGCRGVTILLEDETGQRLQVASTTGIQWREDIPEHQHYYQNGEGQTGEVWATGEIAMISDNRPHHEGDYWGAKSYEVGNDAVCRECMYASIGRPWSSPVGVVRIVDKIPLDDGCQATTMFTDDDGAMLDSIIQAALPQIELLLLQERQLKALSRMTHEFKNPLLAIQGSVDLIRRNLKAKGTTIGELLKEDYLEDILDWCQIMGNQVNNARIFAASPYGGIKLNLSRTLLRADVILPAIKHLRRFLKNEGIRDREIEIGDFSSIPPLYVDKSQMLQVALNLISNAIKYRDRTGRFRMVIEGWQHGSAYVVKFADYGMGVQYGLETAIFEPGFRSREATLRDSQGQGVGLAVIETVLKSHGGQIRLTCHQSPTTFEITLPRRLRYSDWQRRIQDDATNIQSRP
ncbi:MAG: ATP-binding protein [Verrucomicrobia bacterium]|nr:ATP-binding protein [Verrucomicrobiota bacterium]